MSDHDHGKKRSPSDLEQISAKKRRISAVDVTPAIWQRIFTFLDPISLGRTSSVNKTFNACLSDHRDLPSPPRGNAQLVDSESIWKLSRHRYATALPAPIDGMSERDMLTLIMQTHCQRCHRPSNQIRADLSDVFQAGPGPDGVRIIWPYAVRLCGPCLLEDTIKDTELLRSPMGKFRRGLTHTFRAPDMQSLMPWQVDSKAPPSVLLFKVFHVPMLNDMRNEHESISLHSPDLVGEWQNYLPERVELQHEQSRAWHAWESTIDLNLSLAQAVRDICLPRQFSSHPMPTDSSVVNRKSSAQVCPITCVTMNNPPPSGPVTLPPGRSFKTVQAAKAAKKADIEQRCLYDIIPPINPNVLQHMSAFQAATQIPQPLTEHTWSLLKSRLMVQREEAEEVEYKQSVLANAMQATYRSTASHQPWNQQKADDRERDRERTLWEESQESIRDTLSALADKFIDDRYAGGHAVTNKNYRAFSAELFVVVRYMYVQCLKDSGTDFYDPRGFLSLDAMKWVYENKIRPIVARFGLELFLCSVCEDSRHYAFEGMIQHFGAKHDDDFGENNVIVQWRKAEWTVDPPFLYTGRRPGASEPVSARASPVLEHPIPALAAPDAAVSKGVSPALNAVGTDSYTSSLDPGVSNNLADILSPLLRAISQQVAGVLGSEAPVAADKVEESDVVNVKQTKIDESARQSTVDGPLLDLLANAAASRWSAFAGVMDMPNCVRLAATLRHLVTVYEQQCNGDFQLGILHDMLQRRAAHSLLSINDLACQDCVSGNLGGSEVLPSFDERTAGLCVNNLPDLIRHFRAVHRSGTVQSKIWLNDMIELPDDKVIRGLMTAVGMNDSRLSILAEGFPSIFPTPLPRIGTITAALLESKLAIAAVKPVRKKKNKRGKKDDTKDEVRSDQQQDRFEKPPGGGPVNVHDAQDASDDSMPEAPEDEYDPRRPRFASNSNARGTYRAAKLARARSAERLGHEARGRKANPRDRERERGSGARARDIDWVDPYAEQIPDVIRSSDLSAAPAQYGQPDISHAPAGYDRGHEGMYYNDPAQQSYAALPAASARHMQYSAAQTQAMTEGATITRMPERYLKDGRLYQMIVQQDIYGRQSSWLEPANVSQDQGRQDQAYQVQHDQDYQTYQDQGLGQGQQDQTEQHYGYGYGYGHAHGYAHGHGQ